MSFRGAAGDPARNENTTVSHQDGRSCRPFRRGLVERRARTRRTDTEFRTIQVS